MLKLNSKECLTLFHQKLLFDLSKYMAIDIMKILSKKSLIAQLHTVQFISTPRNHLFIAGASICL